MSDFRISKDSKKWFDEISKKDELGLDFDIYYFCLMAGLSTGYQKDLPASETLAFVETFPNKYKDKSKIIISLFLARELSSLGVNLTDKKEAHEHISRLISPLSPNFLSDEGMKQLNKYSAAGFEVLKDEWFVDKPRTLESFLRIFSNKISAGVKDFQI